MTLDAPVSAPPLMEGDTLTSAEFLRRWEEMPDVKRAELIDGIVYMPSPVSREHSNHQTFLSVWLGNFAMFTQGCWPLSDATWLLGEGQTPQPDLALQILPEYGGQSGSQGSYAAGVPELIVEIAISSYSRDFGVKKRLYERVGVGEYLIVAPRERKFTALELTSRGYQPTELESDGVFRSIGFPGLWLDIAALWDLDLQRMQATLNLGLATPEHAAFAADLAARKPK